MVQAVQGENLTEGAEWGLCNKPSGVRTSRAASGLAANLSNAYEKSKARKNVSVRQEPDRKKRERPATAEKRPG
jgi:hypothetical protein